MFRPLILQVVPFIRQYLAFLNGGHKLEEWGGGSGNLPPYQRYLCLFLYCVFSFMIFFANGVWMGEDFVIDLPINSEVSVL